MTRRPCWKLAQTMQTMPTSADVQLLGLQPQPGGAITVGSAAHLSDLGDKVAAMAGHG